MISIEDTQLINVHRVPMKSLCEENSLIVNICARCIGLVRDELNGSDRITINMISKDEAIFFNHFNVGKIIASDSGKVGDAHFRFFYVGDGIKCSFKNLCLTRLSPITNKPERFFTYIIGKNAKDKSENTMSLIIHIIDTYLVNRINEYAYTPLMNLEIKEHYRLENSIFFFDFYSVLFMYLDDVLNLKYSDFDIIIPVLLENFNPSLRSHKEKLIPIMKSIYDWSIERDEQRDFRREEIVESIFSYI